MSNFEKKQNRDRVNKGQVVSREITGSLVDINVDHRISDVEFSFHLQSSRSKSIVSVGISCDLLCFL